MLKIDTYEQYASKYATMRTKRLKFLILVYSTFLSLLSPVTHISPSLKPLFLFTDSPIGHLSLSSSSLILLIHTLSIAPPSSQPSAATDVQSSLQSHRRSLIWTHRWLLLWSHQRHSRSQSQHRHQSQDLAAKPSLPKPPPIWDVALYRWIWVCLIWLCFLPCRSPRLYLMWVLL